MKNYIIITEGMTDSGVVESILENGLNFTTYKNKNELNELLDSMIGHYPTLTGDLMRQPSPMFYYKNDVSVAIVLSNGCTNIVTTVANHLETIINCENVEFSGFLIINDTDKYTEETLTQKYIGEFEKRDITFYDNTIKFEDKEYSCFFNFIPHNEVGAIEKVLLQCAENIYEDIFNLSKTTRMKLEQPDFEGYRKMWATDATIQSFYMDKAQFGIISSVLKPDKPHRIFIKDKLLTKQQIPKFCDIDEFMYIYNFLKNHLI